MKRFLMIPVLAMFSACSMNASVPGGYIPADMITTDLEPFQGVELRGGGDLVITQGDDHVFEITSEQGTWEIAVKDDLLIVGCPDPCPKNKKRSANITLPNLEDIAVKGGGDIRVEGEFKSADTLNIALAGGADILIAGYYPNADTLNIAINGGGDIEAYNVNAREANVSINGGGDIALSASEELSVSIVGGGDIRYRGNPDISKSVIGGGAVRQVR